MTKGRGNRVEAKTAARMRHAPALVLGMLVAAVVAGHAHATLYKWTDERGEVHYSDKLPVDAVNRASTQLSRQGLVVHHTEQARPIVQPVARTESEEQKLREAARAKIIAARRDRALIESYASESEIDLAKTRAVATIEGQLQSAHAFIAQMMKRRQELEDKKPTYAPRPVPGSLVREIENIDAEVERQNDFIAAKEKESASVAARYDDDKERFRELRAGASGSATAGDGHGAAASPAGIELTSAR